MKGKRIISLVLVVLLLIGVTSALAAGTAGSASDPLISLSYITDTYIPDITARAKELIKQKFDELYERVNVSGSGTTGSIRLESLGSGSTVTMTQGGSVILLSGEATLDIAIGSVINTTTGTEAVSGEALAVNSRYMATDGAAATVNVSKSSIIAVDGSVNVAKGEGKASPFLDVNETDWFFSDVLGAIDMGFIKGKTSTVFDPGNNLTVAETILLAATIHQKYHTGSITLTNGDPWYQPYVDYAAEHGLVTKVYENYDAYITRGEFVSIFYRTMPEREYPPINPAEDGDIHDVALSDTYGPEIYTFYRAGIVTGREIGYFYPGERIERSEIATLINRMFDASVRKQLQAE